MKITCQSCQAKYTIADEKVAGKTVKIKCKKCGATIVVNGTETASTGALPGPAAGVATAASEPLTTMVAPHFLHLILTVLPTTFSSAIVYFAWQDWHVIFIAALPTEARGHGENPHERATAVLSTQDGRIAFRCVRDQG